MAITEGDVGLFPRGQSPWRFKHRRRRSENGVLGVVRGAVGVVGVAKVIVSDGVFQRVSVNTGAF